MSFMLWTFVIFISAAIGSWACVIYTRAKDKTRSMQRGRSRCCNCAKLLPKRHNIPIISWLWLRGRAACCGAYIPLYYLGFEACHALGGIVLVVSLELGGIVAGAVFMTCLFYLMGLLLVEFKTGRNHIRQN